MKSIAIVLAMASVVSADTKTLNALADIPVQIRQKNYAPNGAGSCVHASTINQLRWHNKDELADWWRDQYHSGEWSTRLMRRLLDAGVEFLYTDDGDVDFLDWATRNRLLVGLPYWPAHYVNLVDLTQEWAIILDNNYPGRYIYVPRDVFIANWKNKYSGFAIVLNANPPPPWPAQGE